MNVTTTWTKGMSSVITNNRGHEITVDVPEEKGGENLGATAFEVCLMSYSGCVSTVFSITAKKMRIEFDALEVDTIAQQKNDAPTFTDVELKLRISSKDDDEKLNKCLEQTLKICPVGALFHQSGVKTTYNIERMKKN